jgi:Protein of unknown function (DUF732)
LKGWFRLGAATGFAAVVLSLVVAGTALTRAEEHSYVLALDRHGAYYSAILDVIGLGKPSCHRMHSGMTLQSTLDNVVLTGYSRQEAVPIVAAAMGEMCLDQFSTGNGQPPIEQGIRP